MPILTTDKRVDINKTGTPIRVTRRHKDIPLPRAIPPRRTPLSNRMIPINTSSHNTVENSPYPNNQYPNQGQQGNPYSDNSGYPNQQAAAPGYSPYPSSESISAARANKLRPIRTIRSKKPRPIRTIRINQNPYPNQTPYPTQGQPYPDPSYPMDQQGQSYPTPYDNAGMASAPAYPESTPRNTRLPDCTQSGTAQATAAPISLDVLLVKKHMVNGVQSYLPIKDGDILLDGRGNPQAGDKFRVMFRANTDGYVYVIAVDGSAWAQGIFPTAASPFANPVKAGPAISLAGRQQLVQPGSI